MNRLLAILVASATVSAAPAALSATVGPRLFVATFANGVKECDLAGNELGQINAERNLFVEPYAGELWSKSFLSSKIAKIGVDGCITEFPLTSTFQLEDLHVDPFGGYLYALEDPGAPPDRISRRPLGGGPAEVLVGPADGVAPSDLAIDFDQGTIFVADRDHDRIVTADLDGSNVQTLLGGIEPGPMASAGGRLYFVTEIGGLDRLSWMQVGQPGVHPIFTTSSLIVDVEVDAVSGYVYWVVLHDRVWRSDLDGAAQTAVFTTDLPVEIGVYDLPCDKSYAGPYGFGLAGTLGVPALDVDPNGLGNPVNFTLGNSAGAPTVGMLAIGLRRTCTDGFLGTMLQVDADLFLFLGLPATGLALSAQTTQPTLCNTPIYFQWFVSDPGAPPPSVASSKPARVVVGP